MTWIAATEIAAGNGGHPAIAGELPPEPAPASGALARGSVYLEIDFNRWDQQDRMFLVLRQARGRRSHISLHLGADRIITYARRLDREHRQVTLDASETNIEGPGRLTVSWDNTLRRGLLSLELGADGTILQTDFPDPLPWLRSDVDCLASGGDGPVLGPGLSCFGVSDRFEPVGIMPTLATGTPILTPQGYRPVEMLRAGDFVLNADSARRRVLWAGAREVVARGQHCPIRLHAPYFGLLTDVTVAPDQRLLIGGPEVEYLFSQDAVLVEARALLNSNFASHSPVGNTTCYHQVLLDTHDTLDVAGCNMESLFIGNLREMPGIHASTVLRAMPANELPLHAKLAYPALRSYEATSLRAALASR